MKQIEVQIMGQTYLLTTSSGEGEAVLRQAVAKVDTAMCQIRDAGKIKARERIAVLAALNIAAQSLGAQRSPPAAPQPSGGPQEAPQTPLDNSPQYEQLMARLDEALGSNGRLL